MPSVLTGLPKAGRNRAWLRAALLALPLCCLGLTGAGASSQPVDETALRHYAAQRQVARVEAEARRLAALNPGWTMPADLWTARPSGADERPLWALFAADDMARLKLAIAARQKAEPGWKPSDDLAGKIRHKEARAAILKRAASGHWSDVAELAADLDQLGRSNDVELIWTVAEGLARSDRMAEAVALYKDILAQRNDPKERIATMHKAIALLPMAEVETLLALGRSNETGVSEFASIAIAVTRARISAILHDQRKEPIGPAEMALFEAYAKGSTDAGQSGLVAWLALKQERHADALAWFRHAIAQGGDAMIAHGLAHTLLRLGQRREAEDVAFAARDALINNAILFIDILEEDLTRPQPATIEPERLARYARVTLDTRSGEGAQALGWYAYNACQFETALGWFQRASAWLPKEATIFGQALSLQRLKRQREFLDLVNRYDGLFPKVVALVVPDGSEAMPGPCDAPARRHDGAARPSRAETGMVRADLRIPSADGRMAQGAAQAIRRSDFPLAVAPENPLRFGPVLPASGDAWRTEAAEARPLAARRVPGVMAMPYERLGFTLLAGWNGVQTASDVRAADKPPASGTLWARNAARAQAAGHRAGHDAARTGHNVMSGLIDRGGPALISQRFRR
ncbi:MAG: hypothetical protein MUC44_11990 [Beijerinckiaceae bacterium]|jgi:tetratricopeptide (TPR) repeat protein|nr:hypothetical protein [Beijerinckiaceae bacterium]